MTFRTTSPGRTPHVAPERAACVGSHDAEQPSADVREPQPLDGAGGGPSAELPASRLREVLDRVTGGHYDRPEVKGQVIRRIARDL